MSRTVSRNRHSAVRPFITYRNGEDLETPPITAILLAGKAFTANLAKRQRITTHLPIISGYGEHPQASVTAREKGVSSVLSRKAYHNVRHLKGEIKRFGQGCGKRRKLFGQIRSDLATLTRTSTFIGPDRLEAKKAHLTAHSVAKEKG